jgi:hypothetical protein
MVAKSADRSPRRPRAECGNRPIGSRPIERSAEARRQAELAMTPAERLTLALELSDLCADLAAAGRRALERRP